VRGKGFSDDVGSCIHACMLDFMGGPAYGSCFRDRCVEELSIDRQGQRVCFGGDRGMRSSYGDWWWWHALRSS
jgi:hypothetical protein